MQSVFLQRLAAGVRRQRLLLLCWLVLAGSLLYALDWGLPTPATARLLQRYEPKGPAYVERLEARKAARLEELWSRVEGDSLVRFFRVAEDRKRRYDEVDRYIWFRDFAVGSAGWDELQVLQNILRMRRNGTYYDPEIYNYGGAHLYPIAVLLGVGHVIGYVPGAVSPAMLLEDPRPLGRPYLIARGWGAGLLVLLLLPLGLHLRRAFDSPACGVLGMAVVALSPLAVHFARICKPYAASAAFSMALMLALAQYRRNGRRRWLVMSGICCGLLVGALVPNGPVLLLPFLVLLLSPGRRLGTWALYVMLPTALTFLLFNPFVLTNFEEFRTIIDAHGGENPYGYSARFEAVILPVLGNTLADMGLLFVAPFVLAGALRALQTREPLHLALLATLLAGALISAFFFKGPTRFATYLVPCGAYLAALGYDALRQKLSGGRAWIAPALLVGGLCLAALPVLESLHVLAQGKSQAPLAQVRRLLADHPLRGARVGVVDQLRPPRYHPFPLFGLHLDVLPEAPSAERPPPSYLLSHERLQGPWRERYRHLAAIGPERVLPGRFITAEWYRQNHLYRRREAEATEAPGAAP